VPLAGSLELCHRQVPGIGGLVACECRKISEVRDCIALLGDPQTLSGSVFALPGGALADITAELVSGPIESRCEIVITGGLVAIGRGLVAFRACLIVLRAAVIGIRERLVSLAGALIAVGERPLIAAGKR
jgi:hypothetical protein